MTAVANPSTANKPGSLQRITKFIAPTNNLRVLWFNHSKPIKILGLWVTPVDAGTNQLYTVALQSFSVATGTNITSKAMSIATTPALTAGVAADIFVLASGATPIRPADEILALNFTLLTGTSSADTMFTMEYQELES